MSVNKLSTLFERLLGTEQHGVQLDGHFLHGPASVAGQAIVLMGTWDSAAVDAALGLAIAAAILAVVEADAQASVKRPIVFIADTQGQKLSRHEELLGLNGCFAHVARCVDLARRSGHSTLTLVHGEAVSGGFLAFGMLADYICALPGAQVRVMELRAMSRVTKIPLEQLQALAQESAVFAPGAANYWQMGAIHELWPDDVTDWSPLLAAALLQADKAARDQRAGLGAERGGRQLAAPIATLVEHA